MTVFVNCGEAERGVACAFEVVDEEGAHCISHHSSDDAAGVEACTLERGVCITCGEHHRIEHKAGKQATCAACGAGCVLCNTTHCLACEEGSIFNDMRDACIGGKQTSLVGCSEGFFLEGGECVECGEECTRCRSSTECVLCREGTVNEGGVCRPMADAHCCEAAGQKCTVCCDGFHLEDDGCTPNTAGCRVELVSGCVECMDGLSLSKNSSRTVCSDGEDESSCAVSSTTGCMRCAAGSFERGGACDACSIRCSTCGESREHCTSCFFGSVLSNSTCTSVGANLEGCGVFVVNSARCAVCKDGFFLLDGSCVPCNEACKTCRSATDCTACNPDGFFLDLTSLSCTPTSTLSNCTRAGETGCVECAQGFFVRAAMRCAGCASGCTACS